VVTVVVFNAPTVALEDQFHIGQRARVSLRPWPEKRSVWVPPREVLVTELAASAERRRTNPADRRSIAGRNARLRLEEDVVLEGAQYI
jgi:hypothetical protein